MAVTIVDNTTIVNEADSGASWQGNLSTFSGFEREATSCVGEQASQGYHDNWVSVSVDLSNQTIFGWVRSGAPHTEASNGFGFVIGDGTNRIAYTVGGTDNWGHFVQGWGGFKMDGAIRNTTAGNFRTLQGTEGSLSFTGITELGYSIGFQAKANGNAENLFWDILRRIANGTAALTVQGGTAGDPGTFANIVAADAATTNQAAYGIFRTIVAGSKLYEMFYGCEFGDSGTADSYFSDSDFQLFIVGPDMTAGNMDFTLLANGTGTNLFELINGVIIGIGTVSNWDLTTTNSDTMRLVDCSFVDLGTFLLPPTGGTTREVTGTNFTNCGQIRPDTITFQDVSINGSTDANGALLLPSNTVNMSSITFNSDGTGHAIYANTTGTYDLDGITYTGYGADGTTDAAFFNDSGGSITLNIVGGGDSPTVRNGAGANTTINNNTLVTLTGMKDNTEVRVYNAGTTTEIAGIEDATAGTTNDREFSFTAQAGTNTDIRTFNINWISDPILGFSIPSNDTEIPIAQRTDRVYANP